jgi:hypothetical protein
LIKTIAQIPIKLILGLIWIYQKAISPLFPPSCRFHPTCSNYAVQALKRHGLIRGFWLAFVRIMKCQPFYKGNPDDPVPPAKNGK